MRRYYSKEHYKYLKKTIPKHKCNICNVTKDQSHTKRLVWDHDHKTGYIRGVLCDLCNDWIEKYIFCKRNNIEFTKKFGLGFGCWAIGLKEKIEFHLSSNTGILYSDS